MSSLLNNLESILSQTVSTATSAVSSATSAVSRGESPMGALAGMLGMNLGGGQQGSVQQTGQAQNPGASPLGPLSGLLGPAALGGLAGVLLGGKGMRSAAGGALLASGGTYLWDKYKDQIKATYKEL
ncbi:hypothetical protein LJC46_10285, partial [Desulfovibrio sp. OttesenSCG-928-G15]|nr:hypothetical protein [Desulfovibrio sp. OttesenSCG-928-G15]